MASYVVVIHVFTLIVVLCFDVPWWIHTIFLSAIMGSLVWAINSGLSQPHFFLKYESTYQRWSVSSDNRQWHQYESIRVAYLNESFVWIILASPGGARKAAIIGVDSMLNERFLQLRRCILCPDLFNQ